MIGRLLCRLGLHHYDSKSEALPHGYHRDTMSCQRPGCTVSYSFTTHRSDPVNW